MTMKNLNIISNYSNFVSQENDPKSSICLNPEQNMFYVSVGATIIGYNYESGEADFKFDLKQNGYKSIDINGIEYLIGEDAICISDKNGELLLLPIAHELANVECVGSVESGIEAMSWSPDQELVTIATGHGTVILMTREFDPIRESPVHQDQFGEGEFMNVGWGKKETQFHGSKGKQAALGGKKAVEAADNDDGRCRIAWRDDGKYFTISYIDHSNGCRRFRIWNRECVLQYTSELVSGIEQEFAWKSTTLMTTTQRKPHRHDVVLFETNGLQHGEFTLPFDKDQVKVEHLSWNLDSTVLLIWLNDVKEENKVSYLQLWTCSNYHWYLKQHFKYTEDKLINNVRWDPDNKYVLHTLHCDGTYRKIEWNRCVDDSADTTKPSEDNTSLVASIDGRHVNMTPFSNLVVPPPMCAYQLCMPSFVNSVSFCHASPFQNDLLVLMDNMKLAIFNSSEELDAKESKFDGYSVVLQAAGGTGFKMKCKVHNFSTELVITDPEQKTTDQSALHHLTWVSEHTVVAISPTMIPKISNFHVFRIDYEQTALVVRETLEIESIVQTVHCDDQDVILQLENGNLKKFNLEDLSHVETCHNILTNETLHLTRKCDKLCICSFNDDNCIIALTQHSQLLINNIEISSNCTSFAIHTDFVFFTTNSHQLHCINRNVDIRKIIQFYTTNNATRSEIQMPGVVIETTRSLERGATIVTVTPSDTRLILQMPRGNLEVIHPRCLVLVLITRSIACKNYLSAFTVMRKHRINMNLFYDINPKEFLENVDQFVGDISSTQHLNLFLSDLKNEDYTKVMYSQYYYNNEKDKHEKIVHLDTTKVDLICDAMIKSMEKDEERFLLSIATAHVKKSTSEVGMALQRVKKYVLTKKTVAAATLQLLSVLVDANVLFMEALGTYDFELVVMVAEKSQKDPKEYLPMLRELLKLPENYRKYKIDVQLRKYESALASIVLCQDKFDECLEFIKEQKLYKAALPLFKNKSEEYNVIVKAYAEYLHEEKRYNEAGGMFLKCEDSVNALKAYESAGNYNMCLTVAHSMAFGPSDRKDLALKAGSFLKSHGEISKAIGVLAKDADDVESAVEIALEDQSWSDIVSLATTHNRTDLIETHLKHGLQEACQNTVTSLTEYRSDFHKHTVRIENLRKEKERLKLQALLEGDDGLGMNSDLYSDTSSMTGSFASAASSSYSRSTGRSSKSRKKHEKRRYSLKQGSKYEDLALLQELHKIVKNVFGLEDDVKQLLLFLTFYDFISLGKKLSQLYLATRNDIRRSLIRIWTEENVHNMLSTTHSLVTGPQATVNSILSSVNQKTDDNITKNPNFFQDLQLMIPPVISSSDRWQADIFK